MMNLTELNLSGNQITSLEDLKLLPNLKSLDISKNKLDSLENFPLFKHLETLNADENAIEKAGQLEHLRPLICLANLRMAGNPWVDEKGDDFRKEVLIALDNLKIKFINGAEEEVTEEERQEAATEKQERIKAEEEARAAAAEAAANGEENPEAE